MLQAAEVPAAAGAADGGGAQRRLRAGPWRQGAPLSSPDHYPTGSPFRAYSWWCGRATRERRTKTRSKSTQSNASMRTPRGGMRCRPCSCANASRLCLGRQWRICRSCDTMKWRHRSHIKMMCVPTINHHVDHTQVRTVGRVPAGLPPGTLRWWLPPEENLADLLWVAAPLAAGGPHGEHRHRQGAGGSGGARGHRRQPGSSWVRLQVLGN